MTMRAETNLGHEIASGDPLTHAAASSATSSASVSASISGLTPPSIPPFERMSSAKQAAAAAAAHLITDAAAAAVKTARHGPPRKEGLPGNGLLACTRLHRPSAPPPKISAGEEAALRVRALGSEGTLERSIYDSQGVGIGVKTAVEASFTALRRLPAFQHFNDETVMRIARLGKVQRRERYAMLYHEGSPPDGLFVLLSGTVRLSSGRDVNGREIRAVTLFGMEAFP